MMLVTGPLGTVFHTGDFRYNGMKMISDIGLEYKGKIDYLYLDNTFALTVEDFPS